MPWEPTLSAATLLSVWIDARKPGDWLAVALVLTLDATLLLAAGTPVTATAPKNNSCAANSPGPERFRLLAALTRTVTWEVDARGLYTFVSDAAREVLGYSPAEIVGRTHFYDLHPEEGRDQFKADALDVFHRKESFVGPRKPRRRRDGRIVWMSTSGLPVLNADGTLAGSRGSDTDITERRDAKQRLEQLADRLVLATRAGDLGLWDYNLVNNKLTWDDRVFERLVGLSRDGPVANSKPGA